MDTLFLAFANQSDNPLPTLQEEDDTLSRLLAPRAKERHFLLHRDSFVSIEKLASFLTLYRDDLVLFLFSGHAGRDALLLRDGEAGGGGIAQMLGQCPRLKLVFLNGCSTQGQVARLLEGGVPAIIATSAPVNDRKAAFFSVRFFEALQQQFSLREAFNMAKGALEAAFAGVKMDEFRGLSFSRPAAPEPTWGLFCSEKNEHVLDWKLPLQAVLEPETSDFTPNQYLIDTLFAALAEFSPEVQKMQQQAQRGIQVTLPRKRMAVLNAMPAPLAEPLRKLMVPMPDENEGYDKISEARLRQIAYAYAVTMELLGFTMLAQLWEALDDNAQLDIQPDEREALRAFFRLSQANRETFDFLPLTRTVRGIFDRNNIRYFVSELDELSRLLRDDAAFAEAVHFLNSLRLQMRQEALDRSALAYLSRRGEESLALLCGRLGFLARYKLATIQSIDVLKFRHKRTPDFSHSTVMLHDLLGGFDLSELQLDRSLDNRSILLLNEETWEYLNLSPFVLDENAFQDRAEICKLYFFSHYLRAADTWFFRYVNRPDEPFLEISQKKYDLVKDQFDAFASRILQRNQMSTL